MSGTLDSWIATNGSWSTQGDWQNGLPNAGSLAGFGGTLAETISFATTAAIDGLAGSDAAATLDINSGTLAVATGGSWNGTALLSGGTLALSAGDLTFSGSFKERPGATAQITGGATLTLSGGGTLNSTVNGAGMLLLAGGQAYTVGSGAAFDAGTVEIADNGGTVTLGAAATAAGDFVLSNGVLALGGHTLTMKGGGYLAGTVQGPGELAVAAPATIGYLTVDDGAMLADSSTLLESGNLQLGAGTADSATLSIAAGGTYEFVNDVGVTANGTASIVNAGVLEKAGGTGNTYIAAGLDSTGKIIVSQGTIGLQGPTDTISGAVSGAGTLNVLDGTLDLTTASLSVGGFGAYGGPTVLDLNASPTLTGSFVLDGATLDIATGKTLTLKGGSYLRGLIEGAGGVAVGGSADLNYLTLGGGAVLTDRHLITTDGPLQLGTSTADSASLTIDAGATFDLLNDSNSSISADGTASIDNAGLFEMTASGLTTYVAADMTSTGKLMATAGNTLALEGAANTLSGSLIGAGEIDLRGGGTFSIAAGTTLAVSALGMFDNLTTVKMAGTATYGGTLLLGGGATLDYAAAGALTLTGNDNLDGTLLGLVAVTTKAAVQTGGLTLSGGAKLIDASVATQTGTATLGTGTADSATLQVNAGATYDINYDANINAAGTAVISNAGLFEKTAVTGTSIVAADIDSTGTIVDALGTLALEGPADTIGGDGLQGAGEIDLRGGGKFTLAAGAPLGVATLGIYDAGTTVTLDSSESYAGNFSFGDGATLDLAGVTLTLDSGAVEGTVDGGTVLVDVSAETGGLVLTGNATLDDASLAVLDTYTVTLGTGTADSATLLVGAGATYDILTDTNIAASGTALIDNGGLFEKTDVTGISNVYADIDSTGTLAVTRGTLALYGATNTLAGEVTGASELDLRGGGTTTLAGGVALSVATLVIEDNGTTVIPAADTVYKGQFALDQGSIMVLNGDTFTVDGTGLLAATISGTGEMLVAASSDAQGLTIIGATLDITGTLTEDGSLTFGTYPNNDGTIDVASAGTYDLISDNTLGLSDTNTATATGTATINNAGTFEKTETDGISVIQANVTNTGKVIAALGTMDFTGTLANDGTITATNAAVLVNGALGEGIGDHGVFDIGRDGTVALALTTGVDPGQSFDFTGSDGTLRIYGLGAFSGTIDGFASGDTIDLGDIPANGISYSGGVLTVTETQNGTLEHSFSLDVPGIANPGSLALVYDNNGGTAIVLNHAGPAFTNPSGSIIDDYWTVDTSGNWSAANWYQVVPAPPPIYSETIDVPPNAGNNAIFEPAGTADFTVTYNETATVNSLVGDVQATLDVTGGALTVNDGGLWGGGVNVTGGTFDAVSGWQADGPSSLGGGATIEVDAGTFYIGSATLAGTVDGQGEFLLETGDHYTIEPGFKITVGTFDLSVYNDGFASFTTLDANLAYAGVLILTDYNGNPATLDLNGHTLTLSGNTSYLNGAVWGAGTLGAGTLGGGLVLAGTAEVSGLSVQDDTTVTVSGTVVQDGPMLIGNSTITPDNSVVSITKTGTWNIVNTSDDTSISGYAGSTLDNAGTLEKTGGTGSSIISVGTFTNTGRLDVAIGTLILQPTNGNLGGTITGAGWLDLGVGQFTLDAGAAITTTGLSLILISDGFGITLTLDEDFNYAGTFTTIGFSTLNVNGLDATFGGASFLTGLIDGGGTLSLVGPADVNGLSIDESVVTNVTGTVTQDGLLTIGDSGQSPDNTVISIAKAAVWDIVDGTGINGYGNSTIDNAGTFEKTGGDSTSIVGFDTFTTTGQIAVDSGTLILNGLNGNLGGTITGAGWLDLGVGQYTLDAGATISTTGLQLILISDGFSIGLTLDENLTYAGTFSTNGFSTLNLNKFDATFTGASTWAGVVDGAGTLGLVGVADIAYVSVSDALVNLSGTVESTNDLNMSNGAALDIAKGAVFDMLDDGNAETGGTVVNAGLIEKTAGTGDSSIQGNLTETGTIDAATGTIEFQDAASSTIGGMVEGAGTVYFVSGGNYTLDPGTKFTVATLGFYGNIVFDANFGYANDFVFGGGTLDLNHHSLSLAGPDVLDGTVDGGGTLTIGHKTTATSNGLTLAGATVLSDGGTLIADGGLVFGTGTTDATTLDITATGVLNLNADNYGNFAGSPVVSNAGLIEKTGVTGTSYLDASLANTGTIEVLQGTLDIEGGSASSIGGTVEGVGALTQQGGSSTLAPGVSLTIGAFSLVGGASNVLNLSLSYAGAYTLSDATEDLHGDTLTLSGIADLADGTMAGPGLLDTTGTTSLAYLTVDGGATFDNAGVLSQTADLVLGDATGLGTAANEAGATWNFIDDTYVYSSGSVEGTFDNSGLLEKTSGTGISSIATAFTNAAGATIDIASGMITLGGSANTLAGTIEGEGSLTVQGFATISSLSVSGGNPDFAGGLSVSGTIVDTGSTLFTGGTLSGSGTIDLTSHAVAQIGGTVAAGATVAFLDATSTLALANPAGFAGTIAGMVAGDTLDLLNTPASTITGLTFGSHMLTIDVAGGTSYMLKMSGSYTSSEFHFAADGHNGAAITI